MAVAVVAMAAPTRSSLESMKSAHQWHERYAGHGISVAGTMEAPTGDCVCRWTSYFPGERSNQVSCQAAPIVLKSAPVRVVAPVLPENLTDCCRPTGSDSVAPTRELRCRSAFSVPSTDVVPPEYHVASKAAHSCGRSV